MSEVHGLHRHWFNDLPGRIEQALTHGWHHVLTPLGVKIVKDGERGGPRAFLLEAAEGTPTHWNEP